MKGYEFMKSEFKQSTDVLELKKLQTHFLVHSGPYTLLLLRFMCYFCCYTFAKIIMTFNYSF